MTLCLLVAILAFTKEKFEKTIFFVSVERLASEYITIRAVHFLSALSRIAAQKSG